MNKKHDCSGLVSAISDYVDGNLSEELCHELEKHLLDCEDCKIVVNTLKKTIDIVKEENIEAKMPDEVRHRLFYRLNLSEFEKNE